MDRRIAFTTNSIRKSNSWYRNIEWLRLSIVYTRKLEAEKKPTREGDVVLQTARSRDAIVRLAREEITYFESRRNGQLPNYRKAEMDERFCIDASAKDQCASTARAGDIDGSSCWLFRSEVGIPASEEEPGLPRAICVELDAHMRSENQIRVFRADIRRWKAGFYIERRGEEVDATIQRSVMTDQPPIVFGAERKTGVQLHIAASLPGNTGS